jgi:hypothetical protein
VHALAQLQHLAHHLDVVGTNVQFAATARSDFAGLNQEASEKYYQNFFIFINYML